MRLPGGKTQLRQRLYIAAHQEVKKIAQSLPPPVRKHADQLPVLFEMAPGRTDVKAGIEPDTLGLFSGASIADSLDMSVTGPPQITLYMENIWEYARHDAATYREEIGRTYLHELGHYLGLEENELQVRDLD